MLCIVYACMHCCLLPVGGGTVSGKCCFIYREPSCVHRYDDIGTHISGAYSIADIIMVSCGRHVVMYSVIMCVCVVAFVVCSSVDLYGGFYGPAERRP